MYDTTENYEPDTSRQVAPSPDQPRQAPTDDEYISIKEALEIFTARGRSVTERTLQRYCEKLQLDGQKQITAEGEKWFVRKSSVHRRIDELERFDRLHGSRQVAASRDASAPVAEEDQAHPGDASGRQGSTPDVSSPDGSAQQSQTTAPVMSRHDASSRDLSRDAETEEPKNSGALPEAERQLYERMITVLEEQRIDLAKDKERLQSDKEVLMRQLEVKDKQIDRFFSSERDTKTLFGSLQTLVNGMMSALTPGRSKEVGEHYVPRREALDSGLEREHRDEYDAGR